MGIFNNSKLLFFVFTMYLLLSTSFLKAQGINELENIVVKHKSEGNLLAESQNLNKLVYLYWENNELDKAIHSLKRLLIINSEIKNNNGLMTTYGTLGSIYTDMLKHKQALEAFENQLDIAKNLNKKTIQATATINAASALQNFGEHQKSIGYAENALELAQEENNLKLMRTCYRIIAENYESLGNTDNMIKYFDLFSVFDKKIKNDQITHIEQKSQEEVNVAHKATKAKEQELKNTVDTLREVKELTETQKKQMELLEVEKQMQLLELERQKEKLEHEQQMNRIYIVGLVMFIALSLIIFWQFLQKGKANKLLEAQNKKINQQNKQITDSITYAQTIQQAILPIEEYMNEFCDIFVLYRPKDIVSGDFYWFSTNKTTNSFLIAAVDCTGHGVPGAFMSMIGNTLLNSIVNERKIYSPAEILRNLNKDTQNALKQNITDNADGMDICMCKVEKNRDNKTIITFSGAKRPLFIYRHANKELEQLRGDRLSIGGYHKFDFKITFTDHEIEVAPGDVLYLGSDGFIDQNGINRKRFGTKQLEKTLKEIGPLSMKQQKEKLEATLTKYMQDQEQRDDITLLGVKIK